MGAGKITVISAKMTSSIYRPVAIYGHGSLFDDMIIDDHLGRFEMLETDDDLRRRIAYVAGWTEEVQRAMGVALDSLAERHGLKRRTIKG